MSLRAAFENYSHGNVQRRAKVHRLTDGKYYAIRRVLLHRRTKRLGVRSFCVTDKDLNETFLVVSRFDVILIMEFIRINQANLYTNIFTM